MVYARDLAISRQAWAIANSTLSSSSSSWLDSSRLMFSSVTSTARRQYDGLAEAVEGVMITFAAFQSGEL